MEIEANALKRSIRRNKIARWWSVCVAIAIWLLGLFDVITNKGNTVLLMSLIYGMWVAYNFEHGDEICDEAEAQFQEKWACELNERE